jgi:hypothetical protein
VPSRLLSRRGLRSWHMLVCLVGIAALTGGCSKSDTAQSVATSRDAVPITADRVMQSMVAAYQHAATYQDRGVVRLSYRREGRALEDESPLSVRWQGPNRVHVQAYEAVLVCDGQTLQARIRDAATKDFDSQVVERPAPARLSLPDLYEHDEILSLALRQGLAGYPLQLDLLLATNPLAALRADDATRQLLDPATIDGRACERLSIATADGKFVLWVDRESYVLRRVEYPAATFAGEIAEDPAVEDVRLTAEFRGATLAGQTADAAFAMEMPAQPKRVKKFIPPPRELPSELIGTTVSSFAFTDLTGKVLTSQSLDKRIKVLLWFNNHPACRSSVQQLNQVYRQFQSQSRVAIYAVCAEPSSMTDTQISQLVQLWRIDVPTVRDVQALGRDLFAIPWAPTMVVLNGDNAMQIFEVGANPNLVAELPQVLERLIAGEDLAKEIRGQFERARAAYERALARGEPDGENVEATTPIATQTSPQVLQLRPAWKNSDLQAAGNILAVTDAASSDTRYLVFDGWRTIAEIGGDGHLLQRHELDLPELAGVSQLASAVDGQQRPYYVAWSLRSPQAHVFDAQWHRVLSYPAASLEHEGVQDALLADLNADGKLELSVGFWGATGVHCVSLEGSPRWISTAVSHVSSLAASGQGTPSATLWVASAAGQVASLDPQGQARSLQNNSGQLIHHIFCATNATDAPIPFCGIAYGTDGRRLALGLTAQSQSHWRYNLPAGSFPNQIRFVAAAPLLDDARAPQWLIAGPEGSLHIISQDGKFTDYFQTGAALTGIAGGRRGPQGILVISSDQGLEAWDVSPPTTAARE